MEEGRKEGSRKEGREGRIERGRKKGREGGKEEGRMGGIQKMNLITNFSTIALPQAQHQWI